MITIVPTLGPVHIEKLERIIGALRAQGDEVDLLPYFKQDVRLEGMVLKVGHAAYPASTILRLRRLLGSRWLVWAQRMCVWSKVGPWSALVKVVAEYERAARIFGTKRYDRVYIWNPYCCAFGILGDYAERIGCEVRTIEYGVLPGTLLLDDGFLFNSALFAGYQSEKGKHLEDGERVVAMLRAEERSQLYQQVQASLPAGAEGDPGDVRILVLGLSEVDAGVIPSWGSERKGPFPYHENGVALARAIARSSPRYKVIYKPHPNHNPLPTDRRLGTNAWVVNGDARRLFSWCDVVVANGSKMEIDAMLAGKPVINVGVGILSYSDASYKLGAWRELNMVIDQAREHHQIEERQRYLMDYLGYLKKNLI